MTPLLRRDLPWQPPSRLARLLADRLGREGLVLLEGDGTPLGRRAVLGVDPLELVCCRGLPGQPGASDPFAALQTLVQAGGPWLGWLAYEAAAWLEPSVPWQASDMATLWAARHDPLLHFDLVERRCWLEGRDPQRLEALAALIQALPPGTGLAGSSLGETPELAAAARLRNGSGAAAARPVPLNSDAQRAAAAALQGPGGAVHGPGAAPQHRGSAPPQRAVAAEAAALAPAAAADTGAGAISAQHSPARQEPAAIPLSAWRWHTSPQRYAEQVRQLLARIAAGDLFQANLTACCEVELAVPADPLALWDRLRRACPAPFAGLAIAAGEAVISASPERFLQLSATGEVETRPIKGTRPRSADPCGDAAAAAALVSDPKDRAENVMIVDLLRNDLGRVCRPGSITVPQLVGLESYARVHHLTSVVSGRLRPERDLVALLRACWPGGSITGAPKLRACTRLHDLEPVPRGPYCGSLFHLQADGGFDSSILIRSVMQRGRRLRVHAGGGIVADSDPAAEAEEMGWKIQPLLEALA